MLRNPGSQPSPGIKTETAQSLIFLRQKIPPTLLLALVSDSMHAITAANQPFESFFDWHQGDTRTLNELFREVEGRGLGSIVDDVRRTGRPFIANAQVVEIVRRRDQPPQTKVFNIACTAMRHAGSDKPAVLLQANSAFITPPAPESPSVRTGPAGTGHALAMGQQQLDLALEAGSMGVWEWDFSSGKCVWNAQLFELIGMSPENTEPTAAIFMDTVHPDDREKLETTLARVLTERQSYLQEFRIIRADTGEIRWLAGRGRVIFDAADRPVSMIGVNFDITDRLLVEQELRDIDLRRSEFLAILGHELRNPLAPLSYVAGMLELLADNEPPPPYIAGIIQRQVDQLSRLVEDLLDVSRIAMGKIELRKELMSAAATIAAAVETVMPMVRDRGQHLAIHVPPGLEFAADRARVTQVIGNLLQNASKYTQEGGQIEVRASRESGDISITVSDDGPGIEAELVPSLFEPFTQGRTTLDRTRGGLGLGLSVVKQLVEMHGGTVTVSEAAGGRGSTFTVSLPDHQCGDAPGATIKEPAALAKPIRILIVEDNADAATTLMELLRLNQHEVAMANDGEQGLALARQWRPGVIVMDIGLPKLDGWTLAEKLRAEPGFTDTVMIALSGYGQDDDRKRSHQAGFDLHLSKPADISEIFRFIASRLDPACGDMGRTPEST